MNNQDFTEEQELIIKLFLGLTWILDKYASETNQNKDLTTSHLVLQIILIMEKLSIQDKKDILSDAFNSTTIFDKANDIIKQKAFQRDKIKE